MPKDLVQEASGNSTLAAGRADNLLEMLQVTPHLGNESMSGNRFGVLMNLYSNYVEDDYDDSQASKLCTSYELTDEEEHLILERAINSFRSGPVRDKRSMWQSLRASVRSRISAQRHRSKSSGSSGFA